MSSDSRFQPPGRRSLPRDDEPDAARVESEPEPSDPSRSTERLRRPGAQVVAFPRPISEKRRRPEPPAGSTFAAAPAIVAASADLPPVAAAADPDPHEELVERPAYLASELLRQDWFPRTPLARTLRWGALAMGTVGAAGVLAFGGTSPASLAVAAVLACCAIAGAIPMDPARRGIALALLGIAGTTIAGCLRMVSEPAAPLLACGITLAASALFFRGAHRTSRLARVLVATGLVTTASWLVLTGGIDALVVESFAWQDAAGPLARVVLGLALMGSVLTFLDPTGHGGAFIAGAALLGAFGVDALVTMAIAAWPERGDSTLGVEGWVATFAYPFLAAIAAGGLCQVWVLVSRALNRQGRRHASPA